MYWISLILFNKKLGVVESKIIWQAYQHGVILHQRTKKVNTWTLKTTHYEKEFSTSGLDAPNRCT